MAWRVAQWSRELGRGVLSSPDYPAVPFDASRSEATDFEVGEEVEVEVELRRKRLEVRRVRPISKPPAFADPAASGASPLEPRLVRPTTKILQAFSRNWNFRIAQCDGLNAILEGDRQGFWRGPFDRLVVREVSYLELPCAFGADQIVLSREEERAHLAKRIDLSASDVAVTFISVDEAPRFFFLVGKALEFLPRR